MGTQSKSNEQQGAVRPLCAACGGKGFRVYRDAAGKVTKPPGWVPPDIQGALGLRETPQSVPTVEAWRVANHLEWDVRQSGDRWIASFADCHVCPDRAHIGGVGEYGEGPTPEAARRDYPRKIEGKLLCHCPGWRTETMRHLDVPQFAAEAPR